MDHPASPRRLRRCRHLMVELDARPRVSLLSILAGGDGRVRDSRWLARAAHLDHPVPVTPAQMALLQSIPVEHDAPAMEPAPEHAAADLDYLVAERLVFDDAAPASPARLRDEGLASLDWWTPAAVAQAHGRWRDNDVATRWSRQGKPSSAELAGTFGPLPAAHAHPEQAGIPLEVPEATALDRLLEARRTSRRCDPLARLDAARFGSLLYRCLAALGTQRLADGVEAVKKYAPGGGGLHATDAWVMVARVEGLEPGLYRYDPFGHSLALQRAMPAEACAQWSYRMLAGQDWFIAAPALVILVSRFDRLFWKYRNHSKAWKVAALDAGHLSQLMYLAAAELGLGAFITAAVNDALIEEELGLDPATQGVAAVLGFGPEGAEGARELDEWRPSPARRRWLARNPGLETIAGAYLRTRDDT